MKKTVSLLFVIILMFSLCIGITACGNSKSPKGNEADNPDINKSFSVDLAGYVANIGNATSLGISNKSKVKASLTASYGISKSGIHSLSYAAFDSDKDIENKNYIVMSTTQYDANAPETDITGLTKVTFTKTITENITTETTGTKYIIASEGKIFIRSAIGFKYTVYYNNTPIYNEVQDNDANDTAPEKGVIVLDNLIDGAEYKIDYKGIGEETTITQDEIDGEIDKLCIMNGYTFISFVPIGTSQRPSNAQCIEKDTGGYIEYDREGYYSGEDRQSFVIDNNTGYIYPIKDLYIQKLHNNLLYINYCIYDYNVVDDNLNIFPLLTNAKIGIIDYMKDKYGNNYIITDKISAYDDNLKCTYIKENDHDNYALTPNDIVICVSDNICEFGSGFRLKELNSEREPVPLKTCAEFTLNMKIRYRGWDWMFTRVHDGYAYFYMISSSGFGLTEFVRYNLSDGESELTSIGILYDDWVLTSVWIDDNHAVFYTDLVDGSGKLYTTQIWSENDRTCIGDDISLSLSLNRTDELKPRLLLANCIQESWNNYDYSAWRLSVSTLSSTSYYKIVVIDGEVCVVNEENYVAPTPQNFTLYPLNK